MGQKVNPTVLRLGGVRTWESRWYAEGMEYAKQLAQDLKIRSYIEKKYHGAGIARIVIERPATKVNVEIFAARPGALIGKGGNDLNELKQYLNKIAGHEVNINVTGVRRPEIDAKLIADGIAQQLERRVSYRRAMKKAMQSAMKLGADGIRCNVSGRIGGAEIARREWYREGRVPLHTLRNDIDYAGSVAQTTYGTLGVKVFVYVDENKRRHIEKHERERRG